jgi:hypothetical protein
VAHPLHACRGLLNLALLGTATPIAMAVASAHPPGQIEFERGLRLVEDGVLRVTDATVGTWSRAPGLVRVDHLDVELCRRSAPR